MTDDSVVKIVGILTEAGLEIYRKDGATIQLAERVRMHLMDSEVAVTVAKPLSVRFAVRCQRSDFPTGSTKDLVSRVRATSAATAEAEGFTEAGTRNREITDPMDRTHILDTWVEVIFERTPVGADQLAATVAWALEQPKFIRPRVAKG